MEQITVIRPDDSEYDLERLYEPLTTITKAEQVCELLGQDVVNIDYESTEHIEFELGSRIFVFGREYKLNVLPEEQKLGDRQFIYKATFEGPQYDLISAIYFNSDSQGIYTASEFPLTGNLELFIDVLIYNCNRKFGPGSWVKGAVQDTDVKTLSFSNANCLDALQQTICKEFEVEFEVLQSGDVKTINVEKIGQVLNDVYEYGQGNGLYELTRRPLKGTNLVTRLYPYGSTENLKPGYRNYSDRLKIGDIGEDYIEDANAVAAFGRIEGVKVFDDIKPERIGTVTSVGVSSNLFFDTTMNFDLNEADANGTKYLIPGKSAKIHFNTGDLAGYEFEILEGGYVHEYNSFTIIPITDPKGLKIPGEIEPFTIKPGDQYVFLDIVMPDSYVTTAEAKLRTQAQIYYDANKSPLIQYGLVPDPMFLFDKTSPGAIPNFFSLGDYIQVKDSDMNINQSSRVMRFTRDVRDPFRYSIDISDSYQISTIVRVISDVKQLNNIVRVNDLRNPVVARQNWQSALELFNQGFDPDGMLKDGKIRAETLQAAIALFGTEGQQFQLINTVFQPNYLGNKNVIRHSAGQLVHLTIEPDNIRTWNFNGQSISFANDTFKYIYAKCQRSNDSASILFSDEKIRTKEDPTYYYFWIGVLNSVDSTTQTRQISLTYGFTQISGRWITTGQIKSADGSTFFDLDTGEIGGNITFRATDGQNKKISELESYLNARIDEISEQTDGQVTDWYLAGTPTLTNEPAINWTSTAIKNDHVGDLYFDTVAKKSYRFRVDNGIFSWQEVTDDRITQALLLATQAKDTADGKRRIFIAQPSPPYDPGDLWSTPTGLKVCKTQRLTGSYNALDWDLAEVYDNTVTAINGGMAITGALYLANEDGTIKAGIRGGGQGDNEILLFLGASPENAEFAPFRARRSGALELRNRLELFNSSNQGVAGITGILSPSDGTVIAWFGSPFANRATAPTRIEMGGRIVTTSAKIGGWEISGAGMVNEDGSAYIIARSSTAAKRTEAMIGANVFPATYGGKGAALFRAEEDSIGADNYGAVFQAKNATLPGRNYAFSAQEGIGEIRQALINGCATYEETISSTLTRGIDPSLYDFVAINPTAGVVGLGFITTPSRPIRNGKEITILNANDDHNDFFLVNIVRGATNYRMNGGVMGVVKYYNGFWYFKSSPHDNNW